MDMMEVLRTRRTFRAFTQEPVPREVVQDILEAARLAKNANVQKLWLTHYSPSLTEPELYENIAKDIFKNTELGFDGKSESLHFPE